MIKFKKHNLKLVSFFASLTLWLYVVTDETVKVEKTFDVQFLLPKNFIQTDHTSPKVTVLFSTSRWFSKMLKNQTSKVSINIVDLVKQKTGDELNKDYQLDFDLQHNHLQVPKGIKIVNLRPSLLHVTFRKKSLED